MHGRVKVRTSEEEKARKEKERQEKLKVFKHAMQKIQSKRKDEEFDKELLDLTGQVLVSNPDINMLWNIRREILEVFRKDDSKQEDMSKLYDSELQLTEYCLKVNPKSYGSWHQREWVLTSRPDSDWKTELSLCNKYLQLDERNFHTWDYRRFVIRHCKPSLKEEFDYTTEKLLDNFSNYSAWHYRSKILVELHPDVQEGRPIEDSHHKHELKMVQSAAFTDPDDTSAWFYLRWLLGAVKTNIDLVNGTVTPSKTFVAFNQYVAKEYVSAKTQFVMNNAPVTGDWLACTGNQYDKLWIFKHSEPIVADMDIKVHYEAVDGPIQVISCIPTKPLTYVGKNSIDFQRHYSEPVLKELKDQLESCRQLLAMEPDNKWTLLTTTVFLNCIDAKHYHREVIDNLKDLQSLDKLRAGYYDDLKTRWCVENQLYNDYSHSNLDYEISFGEKVSSLPHLQYYCYCDKVDLSDHSLTSKVLPSLIVLQNCKNLSLKNNKLTTLRGFPRLDLEVLDLQGNHLDVEEVDRLRKSVNYKILF